MSINRELAGPYGGRVRHVNLSHPEDEPKERNRNAREQLARRACDELRIIVSPDSVPKASRLALRVKDVVLRRVLRLSNTAVGPSLVCAGWVNFEPAGIALSHPFTRREVHTDFTCN